MTTIDTTPLILTLEEYVSNPLGGPTPRTDRTLSEPEVYRTIQEATRKLNDYMNGFLLQRTVYEEMHQYRQDADSGAMVIRLFGKPVRAIQTLNFVLGQYFGGAVPAPVLTTPWESTPNPAPVVEGNIVIDRNSSILRIFSPVVIYAPGTYVNPFTYQSAARLAVTYTVGFDDGSQVPAADGVSIPYPYWTKDAIRATVRLWLLERRRSRVGRGLAGSYRLGNVSESYKDDISYELPASVRETVDRNYQNWTMA